MQPALGICHFWLGRLLRQMGKADEAREHLAAAIELFTAMDMRFWLDQADAKLKTIA